MPQGNNPRAGLLPKSVEAVASETRLAQLV
jgi:hypothetical protein